MSKFFRGAKAFFAKYILGSGSVPASFWLVSQSFLWGCVLNEFVFNVSPSVGPSMYPTVKEDQIHIVGVTSLRRLLKRPLKNGDIIVFQDPTNEKRGYFLCKRVILTEGEAGTAVFRGQEVEVKIPPNHIWVEGDNKGNSYDSRSFGPVPIALVKGKLLATIFPISDFHMYI